MARSARVIKFIEGLTVTSGEHAGRPFKLRKWQKDFIRAVYDPVGDDGLRQVRTALLTMGRKNGKTTLAAALVLVHLVGPENEMRGQVYSAAADRKQAALIFEEAAAMVKADPELAAHLHVLASQKRIVHYPSGSFFVSIPAVERTTHGFNASFVVYDELAQAPNRKLFDVLTTSFGARAEPLTMVISTQSADPHSIMSEIVDYGEKVRDGVIDDPTFVAAIYTTPDDADPWDEKAWYAANPALGDFRSLKELRAFAETAKRIPAREATHRSLYLNQRIAPEGRLFTTPDWLNCAGEVDLEALAGRECFAGLDLSERRDLTALVLVFPDDGGGFDVLPWFWLPADGLKDKADLDRVPYPVWQAQGHLETTPGRSINYNFVVHRLAELSQTYNIREVVYDRWHIDRLTQAMSEIGLEVELAPFGQGYKDMSPAVERAERGGRPRSGGQSQAGQG
jgi:phage terminase large subunit-like protein